MSEPGEGTSAPTCGTESGTDVSDEGVTTLESLCPSCEKMGTSRIFMTKIPFFREVILMAFECPHCYFRNTEVQSGSEIAEKGTRYELKDLDRQVIKSDEAVIEIPELGFEIPSITQRGVLSTVEGILTQSIDQLRYGQEYRYETTPSVAKQIDEFIVKLKAYAEGHVLPFTFILMDISGKSFIQNPRAPHPDPNCKVTLFQRTREQHLQLGLAPPEDYAEGLPVLPEEEEEEEKKKKKMMTMDEATSGDGVRVSEGLPLHFDSSAIAADKEVMVFDTRCSACGAMAVTKMCTTDIPFFKEVIIMSMQCDKCDYRNNEIKCGGAIPEKGKMITLRVTPETAAQDLRRDCLKSDTASVSIPELELEMEQGSLGGIYTTIEGLLTQIRGQIEKGLSVFCFGDSTEVGSRDLLELFLLEMDKCKAGTRSYTILIKDPLANSWVFNPKAPEPDPNLTETEYTRSWQENEDLGLNDMKTENYD